jgi:FixJ family two-component response regulator
VIIFTAHVLIDARREAQRLGAQDFLNKPLDFDEMLRRVATALTP